MYKLNYGGLLQRYKEIIGFIGVGIMFFVCGIIQNTIWIIFISIVLLLKGIIVLLSIIKTIKNMKFLSQNGTLIKDIPYKTSFSGHRSNLPYFYMSFYIKIEHTLSTGETVKLKSQRTFIPNHLNQHDTVDLLIDLNNPKIYYIDFDIKKIK